MYGQNGQTKTAKTLKFVMLSINVRFVAETKFFIKKKSNDTYSYRDDSIDVHNIWMDIVLSKDITSYRVKHCSSSVKQVCSDLITCRFPFHSLLQVYLYLANFPPRPLPRPSLLSLALWNPSHQQTVCKSVQYFSKPGDTFLVLPRRRNATACPAWRRLGLPCAALPGQARRTHTHALGR